jgi:hypothetical protein
MDIAAGTPIPPWRQGRPVVAGQRIDWTLKDVLFGVLWFIGLFFTGQVLVLPFLAFGDTSGQFYTAVFIVGAIVEMLIGAIAAAFTFRKYGGRWERLGVRPIRRSTLLWALAAFGGAFAVSSAYGVVIEVFGLDFLRTTCAEQIPEGVRHERALLALASLTVIAFAPVFEELFFRGFVFPGLARGWGLVLAIVVSGLLFGGAHLSYKSFVPIASVGMVFAFTYNRSGNIFSTMLAHCAFNSLSIAFIAGGSCDSVAGFTPVHWSLPL